MARAPSPRALRDEQLKKLIHDCWAEHHEVYGAYKVWRQLHRDGVQVARCTVERLMRELGLRGVVRGPAKPVTTVPADTDQQPQDLVDREFTAAHPRRAVGR